MAEFPVIVEKRFFPFRLNELCDILSEPVLALTRELPNEPSPVCDWVIKEISYPFYMGQPDDTHVYNCFHGEYKFCRRIDLDFWALSSETAVIRVGDCEDSSVLCTTLCGKIVDRPQSEHSFEALGVVKDESGNILGGHGWSYIWWAGDFHLIETTLDIPPSIYPVVKDIREPFPTGGIIYEPWVLFNWAEYEEIENMLGEYLKLNFKAKNARRKFEAIAKAWARPVKPLEKAGILAKLRWK